MKRRERPTNFHIYTHYAGSSHTFKTLNCVFCRQEKPIKEFSEMQLAKASYISHMPSQVDSKLRQISCINCTDKQVERLRCWSCHKTMTLDKFAKKQRRSGEKARCLACMKKRDDEDVNDSQPEYSSDGSYSDSWDDYYM
ncbi:Stc1 domain-containing protein [Fennellomyces sp. T-0311]|nr:Stc1 domain-containing protein [Fennellomyces sp. T-0311]